MGQSDARALRVVLSLTGVKEGLKGHVVVEMSDLDNEPLVKLVGGELIETVVAHDVIGRLMIQCALQPGLAQVVQTSFSMFIYRHCEYETLNIILDFILDFYPHKPLSYLMMKHH